MLTLIWRPILVAFAVALVWLGVRAVGGPGGDLKADEGIMSSGTIAVLGIFWTLLAAFAFATVWTQWIAVEEAVKSKDKDAFLKHKDKRIPGTLKMLVSILSLLLVGAFFLISFNSVWAGLYSISAVSFVLALYWETVLDLDDPSTGVWNVTVPEEWKEK